MTTPPVHIVLALALLTSGCATAATSHVAANHPTTATTVSTARCPALTPAERSERLLRQPGIIGPLTAGGIHIGAGGTLLMLDRSGTATALGTVSLGVGVAALAAAGIVALADDGPEECASGDGHAAIDDHRLPRHE